MCDPGSTDWLVQSYRDYGSFLLQKVYSYINEQHKLRYGYVGRVRCLCYVQ